MKILLLCTAHNSLSQRLCLTLSLDHDVTVEYALSADTMTEAANLTNPHLIICPFLTSMVPPEVYRQYLTLVIHPGPPGDGGPSALDWLLMGDDGTTADTNILLKEEPWSVKGRSHWGVTVLQAIEEFDAGPVWAFEQFSVNIDDPAITKSSLYRGEVTRAAIRACAVAIDRVQKAACKMVHDNADEISPEPTIGPHLKSNAQYRAISVTDHMPFQGGSTHPLPLLKATQRDFDIHRHSAQIISRRIRASDSQPGCLSTLFNPSLYVYGGIIEDGEHMAKITADPGAVIGTRNEAVCIKTIDGKGIWITHARRVKKRTDPALWPKVPAVPLLVDLGILDTKNTPQLLPNLPDDFSKACRSTFQEIYVEYDGLPGGRRVAYLTFGFYNGATSTTQCHRTCAALRSILATHTESSPLAAIVMLGGSYFSNGIHLNVIEAAVDPSLESWVNINAINDVVLLLLQDFAAKGITTVSALRGNAAAGGVALAAAADLVVAGENVVLNPAYRALGLYGSEYHTVSYAGRVGGDMARHLLRDMMPLSAEAAKKLGLVDIVIPGHGKELDNAIRDYINTTLTTGTQVGKWKRSLDLSPSALSQARTHELSEMSKDFWSSRSTRYHSRRRDFVRKIRPIKTPLRFAVHRRKEGQLDEEESDSFDRIETFETLLARAREEALKEGIEELKKAMERRNSAPITAGEKKLLQPIWSCYYNS